ncbi:hypothetical protein NNO_0472 [Hydrogenimonas sp.]|nr:hypothetical protein NNO_0472 [Hydrogenimonas sp.]
MKKYLPLIAFFILPTIYITPFLLTFSHISLSPLPPDFSSDIYLYLNYTALNIDANGMTQNPWYHIQVPTNTFTYLKFGLLNLFSILNDIIGNLTLTLIVWNWLWSAITFLCAYILFNKINYSKNTILTIFGISLLFFFQVSDIPNYLKGFLNLDFSPHILLPLQRTFFPQIATPLLLLYLYFLINAFDNSKSIYWIALFIIQYIAFINFPYNTVVMGVTTFFLIVFSLINKKTIPWKYLIIFATAALIADLAFFMNGSAVVGDTHKSLLDMDFSRISNIIGGTNIILLILSFVVLALQNVNKSVKFTIASVGISIVILQLADLIFNPSLQLTHHFAYFANQVFAIVLFYITVHLDRYFMSYKKVFNFTLSACTLLLITIGLLASSAQAAAGLSKNRENYILYRSLIQLEPAKDDLIIAPSLTVNDIATWLPLVYKSEILFSRNSEFLLPKSEEGNKIYWKREAIYLYLQGIDVKKLHDILFSEDSSQVLIKRIIQVGQRFDLHTDNRFQMLQQVYSSLSTHLERLEKDPQVLKRFFSKYRRIILIDRNHEPIFRYHHISMVEKKRMEIDGFSIIVFENE